jgi:hypothetical protein
MSRISDGPMTNPGRRRLLAALGGAAGTVALLGLPAIAAATPDAHATVRFGLAAGSPFPPDSGHDQSAHARDSLAPRTVVIARGGGVTYQIAPFHQPAIYRPGTTPADITLSDATLDDLAVPFPPFVLPNFIINDPAGRVALAPALQVAPSTWTSPAGTFAQPGRYLVICTVLPHFAEFEMYGWVIVQ